MNLFDTLWKSYVTKFTLFCICLCACTWLYFEIVILKIGNIDTVLIIKFIHTLKLTVCHRVEGFGIVMTINLRLYYKLTAFLKQQVLGNLSVVSMSLTTKSETLLSF